MAAGLAQDTGSASESVVAFGLQYCFGGGAAEQLLACMWSAVNASILHQPPRTSDAGSCSLGSCSPSSSTNPSRQAPAPAIPSCKSSADRSRRRRRPAEAPPATERNIDSAAGGGGRDGWTPECPRSAVGLSWVSLPRAASTRLMLSIRLASNTVTPPEPCESRHQSTASILLRTQS